VGGGVGGGGGGGGGGGDYSYTRAAAHYYALVATADRTLRLVLSGIVAWGLAHCPMHYHRHCGNAGSTSRAQLRPRIFVASLPVIAIGPALRRRGHYAGISNQLDLGPKLIAAAVLGLLAISGMTNYKAMGGPPLCSSRPVPEVPRKSHDQKSILAWRLTGRVCHSAADLIDLPCPSRRKRREKALQ